MKRNTSNKLIENIGWAGVVLVVGSYGLLASGVIDSSSALYHASVLVGALAVAVASYRKRDYQPAVLNAIFALFAMIALARLLLF